MKENYCLNWFTASVYACDKHLPYTSRCWHEINIISMSILTVEYINNVCNMKHMGNVDPAFYQESITCASGWQMFTKL